MEHEVVAPFNQEDWFDLHIEPNLDPDALINLEAALVGDQSVCAPHETGRK